MPGQLFWFSFFLDFFPQFKVRINLCFSRLCDQEVDVPQGSILSVHRFWLKINFFVNSVVPDNECFIHGDTILRDTDHRKTSSKDMPSNVSTNCYNWADTSGFKFFFSKTVCIRFCWLHNVHQGPIVTLNRSPVPLSPCNRVIKETKVLGVMFDHKLSFISIYCIPKRIAQIGWISCA